MKRLLTFLLFIAIVAGLAGTASAGRIKEPWSFPVLSAGYTSGWSGVYSGNDTGDKGITSINSLVVDKDIELLGKIDYPANKDGGLSVTYNNNHTAGTWSASPGFIVQFITIKAGNQFVVYDVNSPTYKSQFGANEWSTAALGNKGVSHISFWGKMGAPVPAPSAVWLLGTGLIGLIGVRRKK